VGSAVLRNVWLFEFCDFKDGVDVASPSTCSLLIAVFTKSGFASDLRARQILDCANSAGNAGSAPDRLR
jgi:hypothetical protein